VSEYSFTSQSITHHTWVILDTSLYRQSLEWCSYWEVNGEKSKKQDWCKKNT